jgi:ribosome-associated heat shock protein Hsp15
MRIDRLLWFLRFAKSRTRAQKWIGEGHIRINGERVIAAHRVVTVGDVITMPLMDGNIAVAEIVSIPLRRGPPAEARSCYRRLDEPHGIPQQAAPVRPESRRGFPA